MSLLFELFYSFFRIGLFSFGGGYAMIPLIQSEILHHGWLTADQFADIVAIAEMTPGPIAVNSATYVGYMTAGVAGSLVATAGVTLPSLLLILLVASFVSRYQKHPLYTMIFYGLRPVVVGLIASAAVFIGKTALVHVAADQTLRNWFATLFSKPLAAIQPAALLIFAAALIIHHKFKLHPLILIMGAGLAGILLRFIF
ncbi:MAG: chromate transporter [Clostridiaceae bacterium]|jgi:chromate transporter|nr:chromate transporter [Clostridiaceae bacterium]